MREIKFRGQDKANKKWLYGNLEIPLIDQNHSRHFILGYSYGQYQRHEVDPKTVGQFTGIKDKNGQDIFEGDIIKFLSGGNYYESKVWFEENSGCYLVKEQFDTLLDHAKKHAEIVGNIYENK